VAPCREPNAEDAARTVRFEVYLDRVSTLAFLAMLPSAIGPHGVDIGAAKEPPAAAGPMLSMREGSGPHVHPSLSRACGSS